MKNDFIKIQRNGWIWNIKKSLIQNGFLENIQDSTKKIPIKSNTNRDVFNIKYQNKLYYVKHYHASGKTSRFLNCFFPKCKAEYESFNILFEKGIRTAEIAGWGIKNNQSMLITEELKGFIDAKKIWFSDALSDVKSKNIFKNDLEKLVSKMISAKIYHPDFHLGNILYNPYIQEIAVIDAHGVKKIVKYNKNKLIDMLCVFGAIRGEITDNEAEERIGNILSSSKVPGLNLSPRCLWQKILINESLETEKLWEKRRKQILSHNSKYINKIECNGKIWLTRKKISGSPEINVEEIDQIQKKSSERIKVLNPDTAEKIWLKSFHLQFHRIMHIMPIAWCNENNTGKLIYEEITEKARIVNGELLDEFLNRCKIAGFNIINKNACFSSQNVIFCEIGNIKITKGC